MTEALGFLSQDEARALLDIPPTVTTTLVSDLGALSYAGNGLKLLRVKSTADGWEFLALDTDTTLASNSDAKIASQKAIKTYIDAIVTGLLDLKSDTDCSANPNYPSALKGDAHVVTVAGKIGGASGIAVDIGDVYVAKADNAGGTQASVGTSWFILEHNLAGALLTANNLSDLANVATARGNLGLAIGSDVQAHAANLAAFAALSLIADRLPYANGTGTLSLATFTSAGRAMVAAASAAAQRILLNEDGRKLLGTKSIASGSATNIAKVTPQIGGQSARVRLRVHADYGGGTVPGIAYDYAEYDIIVSGVGGAATIVRALTARLQHNGTTNGTYTITMAYTASVVGNDVIITATPTCAGALDAPALTIEIEALGNTAVTLALL